MTRPNILLISADQQRACLADSEKIEAIAGCDVDRVLLIKFDRHFAAIEAELQRLTAKTETEFDDRVIEIIHQPIFVAVFFAAAFLAVFFLGAFFLAAFFLTTFFLATFFFVATFLFATTFFLAVVLRFTAVFFRTAMRITSFR